MNNAPIIPHGSVAARHFACMLAQATAVIATPCQPGSDIADPGMTVWHKGVAATRSFEMTVGRWAISFVHFGVGVSLPQIGLSSNDGPVTQPSPCNGLGAFIDALGLAPAERGTLLKTMIVTVVPLFRLATERMFSNLLENFATSGNWPSGKANVNSIDGYKDVVFSVAARAKLTAGALVVAIDETVTVGAVVGIGRFIDPAPLETSLAIVAFPRPFGSARQVLVISDKAVQRFEPNVDMADMPAFYRAHAGSSPDIISLLARFGDDETRNAVLAMERIEQAAYLPLQIPTSGLIFSLEQAIGLAGGVFMAGWFLDPNGYFRAAEIIDQTLEDSRLDTSWTLFDGVTEIAGVKTPVKCFCSFVARQERGGFLRQPLLRVTLESGEIHLVRAPYGGDDCLAQRAAILSVLHPHAIEAGALAHVFQPALEPICRTLNARQAIKRVVGHGRKSERRASIIIPLYRELGFIRSQLLAFASDPFIRDCCEIMYVLDDPGMEDQAMQKLGGMRYVAELDIRLVLLKENGGYALANNFGAGLAEGRVLVLMNSDVVPERSGWLSACIEQLDLLPEYSVVGPKLVYADDSLQHAGMYFFKMESGLWQNMHYYKGYGRDFLPASVKRPVPALTGALMVLRRDDFLDVGGFSTDYIIGDYEDSDLCLKLSEKGGQCLYLPSQTLYHFERQSMSKSDMQSDNGSTVYNRALHSQKWFLTVDQVMNRPEFKDRAHVG